MSLFGNATILLASKSPRRRQLVQQLGLPFQVVEIDVDESLANPVPAHLVAQTLAQLKADAYTAPLHDGQILLTADTIVALDGQVLGKPKTKEQAAAMLQALSGRAHEVYTGVSLRNARHQKLFTESTIVHFRTLSDEAIDYYIAGGGPMDKAGAYGIQDWIGLYGVERIEGCYYNVMGLPVPRICKELEGLSGR